MDRACTRRRAERGAAAVEYALVIAVVSLAVIAGPVALGSSFTEWSANLAAQVGELLP